MAIFDFSISKSWCFLFDLVQRGQVRLLATKHTRMSSHNIERGCYLSSCLSVFYVRLLMSVCLSLSSILLRWLLGIGLALADRGQDAMDAFCNDPVQSMREWEV